jgi:hypothetical protein
MVCHAYKYNVIKHRLKSGRRKGIIIYGNPYNIESGLRALSSIIDWQVCCLVVASRDLHLRSSVHKDYKPQCRTPVTAR